MVYYVYTHIFSNGTRYVGKGKGYRATHFRNRNKFWQNLYVKYGPPLVELTLQKLTNKESLYFEKQLIHNYTICNIPLCNLTDGGEGEGHPHTKQHRQKLHTHNPNAKVINIFDHNDILQITYNGTLTTTLDDIPKHAFIKSFKSKGQPLGSTPQARTELRKRMHQQYIGWYALEADTVRENFTSIDNITAEQSLGLTSKCRTSRSNRFNSNAKVIQIFDALGSLYCSSFGNFADICKQYNLPKAIIEKAKRTQQPVYTKHTKHQHLNGFTVKIHKGIL